MKNCLQVQMQKFKHNMRWFVVLVICLVLTGCAPKTTVVLVPDPLGKVGIVEVSNDAGSVTMKKEREATKVSGRNQEPSKTQILSKDQINRKFAEVIAIQPKQPIHFILQFETDSTELTPESKAILPSIVTTIRTNNSKDISSIGHSDTAGNPEYNLKLSQQRAEDVARLLVEAGVNPDNIEATSHGEKNPFIRTDDNVSEPRNRRVEVVVR